MSGENRILPSWLVLLVDQYVDEELSDAAKYENRQPLDESGVFVLHRLAAEIYAAGWSDGEAAEGERARAQRRRKRAADAWRDDTACCWSCCSREGAETR